MALTAPAIHHCLSAWKTNEFTVPPQFGPGGGAQRTCVTKTLIRKFIMHAQMCIFVSTWICVLPRQRFKPNRETLSAACLAEGSTQLVWTQQWHNLTTIRAALLTTSLIPSCSSWYSSVTIVAIVLAALLLLRKLAFNSQPVCLSVGLPSPAATSPSPAATATATATTSPASPKWPALRIQH